MVGETGPILDGRSFFAIFCKIVVGFYFWYIFWISLADRYLLIFLNVIPLKTLA